MGKNWKRIAEAIHDRLVWFILSSWGKWGFKVQFHFGLNWLIGPGKEKTILKAKNLDKKSLKRKFQFTMKWKCFGTKSFTIIKMSAKEHWYSPLAYLYKWEEDNTSQSIWDKRECYWEHDKNPLRTWCLVKLWLCSFIHFFIVVEENWVATRNSCCYCCCC